MASSASTVAHLLDQLAEAGPLTSRKMFGEYAIYLDGKVVGLVCDDQLYITPTPGALALLEHNPMARPFPGAKPYLLIDAALEDQDLMAQVLRAVAADRPPPKPRSRAKTHR